MPALWNGMPIATFGSQVMLAALYGGYPATMLLGIPAYFLLRPRLRPRLITIALCGGIIAAVPWLVVGLLLPNPSYADIDGCRTVVAGHTTWCGYWEDLKFIAFVFGLGTIGGVVFWICAVWRDADLIGPRAGRGADHQTQ
ncbi:MAG TPA: hypothetical protein VMQ73_02025 [Methylomirabilota bacterium]|nr:hypothetical protein [Methylomirabilota bacterium]